MSGILTLLRFTLGSGVLKVRVWVRNLRSKGIGFTEMTEQLPFLSWVEKEVHWAGAEVEMKEHCAPY